MGTRIREEEERARQIIARVLCKPVVQHDDGTQDGMYDLRIGPPESPESAIECIGAVNPKFAATHKACQTREMPRLSLSWNWTVCYRPETRRQGLEKKLQPLLAELERRGQCALARDDFELWGQLDSFGIESVYGHIGSQGGQVHLLPEAIAGFADHPAALVEWLEDFLASSERSDVLEKLRSSRCPDCHVFVSVRHRGAPEIIEMYLTGEFDSLPSRPPRLPSPIDEVWVIGWDWNKGIRWTGTEWNVFDS